MEYEGYYAHFFDGPLIANDDNEVVVNCSWHPWNVGSDDDNPSMYVNIETGKYQCFSCPADGWLRRGGDAEAFAMAWHDVDYGTAKALVQALLEGVDAAFPIAESAVLSWQKALQSAPEIVAALKERRHLVDDSIARCELGWDGSRVVIPIRNYRGDVANCRRYSLAKKPKHKMVSLDPYALTVPGDATVYTIRYGRARLYPFDEALNTGPVAIMAGEWDTILARQLGVPAICTTGGEGHWDDGFTRFFRDRDVTICYDVDAAGRAAAQRLGGLLAPVAKRIGVVELPIVAPANADFTDYVAQHGIGGDAYDRLRELARPYSSPHIVVDTGVYGGSGDADAPVREVSLAEATFDPVWQGKRVRLQASVVGKGLTPYTIPRDIAITCDKMSADDPNCGHCAVNFAGGKVEMSLTPSQDLLHLVGVPDDQAIAELRKMVGIPGRCAKWDRIVKTSQNVEQLILTPQVEPGTVAESDDAHTMQPAYYFYPEGASRVSANTAYEFAAVRTTDPKKQHVVFVADALTPIQDTVASFTLDAETSRRLALFEVPATGDVAIADHLARIAEELTNNVTHIYGRNDLVIAILLLYCSVQQFHFQRERVDNGLLELLVIGDTRTGKSETAARLARYLRLGEIVTAENTSFSGLVGGLQQGGDAQWFVTWGKIPQNNGKLVHIDEVSGLPVDDIARMSGVRSSKVAEIVKVRQARTFARTRLGWYSNPRGAKPLRSYQHGVEAVSELIGKPEDVARFDLVMSCASGEVPDDIINAFKGDVDVAPMAAIPREAFQSLILWCWSRGADDVEYTSDATRATLDAAKEMGATYTSTIPLVESANQRFKIARLAVAVAALTHSADETGQRVHVERRHVEYAHRFMDACYSKASLDYSGFSLQEKKDEELAESKRPYIERWAKMNPAVVEVITRSHTFKAKDLEEQLDMDADEVKDVLHTLSASRMIQSTSHGYKPSAVFISLLKSVPRDGP
jgi:hypothetical protein